MILFHITITFQVICWSVIISSCSKAKPLCEYQIEDWNSTNASVVTSSEGDVWMAPDTSSIPYDEAGALIRYGKALVAKTGAYFGPKGKVNHNANGMNCQNC
ncbi:MAG: hypothetical protein ABJB16_06285, partial [Saprospiraceae bacterium]